MQLNLLRRDFARAQLPLQIESQPLDRGRRVDSGEIVQLDIRSRRYALFLGNVATNRVDVVAHDRNTRHLVLCVDEPRRAFRVTVNRPRPTAQPRLPDGASIVASTPKEHVVELKTTGRLRHLLCGVDDAHLFIAQLPRSASSVDDACDALRPEIPSEYSRGAIRRQGEWFFMPVTFEERRELNIVAPRSLRIHVGLAEVARMRRRGRQHVATEACLLEPGARLYARGEIRHPDHVSLALRGWHRVLPNREPFDPLAAVGIRWAD